MPVLGVGLHLLVALFFAVHAVRTRRDMYWIMILFMFPLLGSLLYFVVVFLPHSRIERGARKAGMAIQKQLDPSRDLREAIQAFDLTPTAQNQMRLAEAYLDAGQNAEAVAHYDACLRGPFASDPEIALGAARAKLSYAQPQEAIELLSALHARQPAFNAERVGLLLASALDIAGHHDEAGAQYESMVERFGSIEARARLAMWAIDNGKRQLAERELAELLRARKHMPRHTRDLHRDLFGQLDAASARLQ